jgi:hypothetical protein
VCRAAELGGSRLSVSQSSGRNAFAVSRYQLTFALNSTLPSPNPRYNNKRHTVVACAQDLPRTTPIGRGLTNDSGCLDASSTMEACKRSTGLQSCVNKDNDCHYLAEVLVLVNVTRRHACEPMTPDAIPVDHHQSARSPSPQAVVSTVHLRTFRVWGITTEHTRCGCSGFSPDFGRDLSPG